MCNNKIRFSFLFTISLILIFGKAFSTVTETSLTVTILNPNNSQIEIFVRKSFHDDYYKISGQKGLFTLVLNNPDDGSDCKIVYSNHKIDVYVLKGEKVNVNFDNADIDKTLKISNDVSGINEFESSYNIKYNSPKWSSQKMSSIYSADNWKSISTGFSDILKQEVGLLDSFKSKMPLRSYTKYYADIFYLNADIMMNSGFINTHTDYLDSVFFIMKELDLNHQIGIINEQALETSANYRFFLRDYFYKYSTIELNRLKAIQSFSNMSYSSRLYVLTDFMFDDNKVREWIKTKLLADLIDFQPLSEVEPYFSRFMAEDSVVDYKEYLLKKHEDLFKDANDDIMNKITLQDINSKFIDLTSYKGKKIYVDFWASWCGSCIDEMMNYLPVIKKQLEDKNVIVISISIDENKGDWKKAIDRLNLSGVQLYAGNSVTQLKDFFHLYSVPQYCILDKDGKLLTRAAPRPSELADDEKLMQTCFGK